jgi:hypothetical protein
MQPKSTTLKISLPIGIGDLLHIYSQLSSVKSLYSNIELAFYEPFFKDFRIDTPEYRGFLNELGQLLFSKPPFTLVKFDNQPFRNCESIANLDRILCVRPRLAYLLAERLDNQFGDYITVSTKIRQLPYDSYLEIKDQLFNILKDLSQKYKIMILGEKEVEYNPEYHYLTNKSVYSIYQDYITLLPADRIIDLTVPKLGITAPDLNHIKYDCSLMANAKYNITLGIGGNFSLAVSIGNVIGYRLDDDHIANFLYSDVPYTDLYITKSEEKFLNKLKEI